MNTATKQVSIVMMLGALTGLAGCATPSSEPTAAAQAAPAPPSPPQNTPAPTQQASAGANSNVEVTFPEGGSILTPEADKQLDYAARLFRDANPVVMFTTGYTDKSGNEYDNVLLSAKRAEAVKRGLVARGIPADRLFIQALGESELADPNDPLSSKNRRVIITWRLS